MMWCWHGQTQTRDSSTNRIGYSAFWPPGKSATKVLFMPKCLTIGTCSGPDSSWLIWPSLFVDKIWFLWSLSRVFDRFTVFAVFHLALLSLSLTTVCFVMCRLRRPVGGKRKSVLVFESILQLRDKIIWSQMFGGNDSDSDVVLCWAGGDCRCSSHILETVRHRIHREVHGNSRRQSRWIQGRICSGTSRQISFRVSGLKDVLGYSSVRPIQLLKFECWKDGAL